MKVQMRGAREKEMKERQRATTRKRLGAGIHFCLLSQWLIDHIYKGNKYIITIREISRLCGWEVTLEDRRLDYKIQSHKSQTEGKPLNAPQQ